MSLKTFKQKVIKFFTFKGFKVSNEEVYHLKQSIYFYLKKLDDNSSISFIDSMGICNIKVCGIYPSNCGYPQACVNYSSGSCPSSNVVACKDHRV